MTPFWPSARHDGPAWAPSSAEASARSVAAQARTTSENPSSTGSAAMIAVVRATDQPVTRTAKYSAPRSEAAEVIDEGEEGEAPQHSVNFGAPRVAAPAGKLPGGSKRPARRV